MAYEYNQAPKEFDKQSAKFRSQFPTLWAWEQYLSEHGRFIDQPKYDGVHVQLWTGKDRDDSRAMSRQGEPLVSLTAHAQEAYRRFGPNKVLYGEAWNPILPHKIINGVARRRAPATALGVWVYDIVDSNPEDGSLVHSQVPYDLRLNEVYRGVNRDANRGVGDLHVVDLLFGRMPNDLYPSGEFDGRIVRDAGAAFSTGAAKMGEVIKDKVALSLDLKIVAQHAEERPTKLGGYLTVDYKGVLSDVGSGLTQDDLHKILYDLEHTFVGSVAEVECLGITPAGKLREPRLKGIRWDTVQEELKE